MRSSTTTVLSMLLACSSHSTSMAQTESPPALPPVPQPVLEGPQTVNELFAIGGEHYRLDRNTNRLIALCRAGNAVLSTVEVM